MVPIPAFVYLGFFQQRGSNIGVGCHGGNLPSESLAVGSVVILSIKIGALDADCNAIVIFLSSLGVHLRGQIGRVTCQDSP